MSAALDRLVALLDLEQIDTYIFRGQNEAGGYGRLFGGQVAAQALVAAGRSVEQRLAHSLHAYFLRGGDPAVPVLYTVDPIRDGSSFTTRRVVAVQRGQAIFNMSVSFHKAETGYEHEEAMPDAPDPDSLATWEERLSALGDRVPEEARAWMTRERAIDFRGEHWMGMMGGDAAPAGPNLVWMRARGDLPEDPFLHQCIATYASDMSLLDSVARRHVRRESGHRSLMMASLDHALWFHRSFRVDRWLLYVQDSPAAAGARGFARGTLFERDGRLVASVAQEGLMRPLAQAAGRA